MRDSPKLVIQKALCDYDRNGYNDMFLHPADYEGRAAAVLDALAAAGHEVRHG